MNEVATTLDQRKLDAPLTVDDLLSQVNLIQKVMAAVMKEGEHYGKIPGCGDKPALLQPGAQKLLVTFRLAPEYAVTERLLDKGHREYQVLCTLKTIGSGSFVGQGAGSASTMEGKWRYRVAPKKLTDRSVPRAYWDLRQSDPAKAQELLGGKGFSTKKDENGQWMIAEGSSEKVEHDNPADYFNTIFKMACKRALVAATLTATAASDIFTQDIEELTENLKASESVHSASETSFEDAKPSQPSPTNKTSPKGNTAQQTASEEVSAKAEDMLLVDFTVEERQNKTTKKPYTLWTAKFKTDTDADFTAGTIKANVGEGLGVLKGQVCSVKYKPGKFPGTYELLGIAAQEEDAVPM
jgi:hypothetical protein